MRVEFFKIDFEPGPVQITNLGTRNLPFCDFRSRLNTASLYKNQLAVALGCRSAVVMDWEAQTGEGTEVHVSEPFCVATTEPVSDHVFKCETSINLTYITDYSGTPTLAQRPNPLNVGWKAHHPRGPANCPTTAWSTSGNNSSPTLVLQLQ